MVWPATLTSDGGAALGPLGSGRAQLDKTSARTRRGHGLISSAAVGAANRGRVLQALFDLGPTSRADLARHVGVNRATISGIIQRLVDQAILVEGEPIPPSEGGGKPARPIWFAKDAQPICAVMLMHDRAHSGLVSLDGAMHAEFKAPFPSEFAKRLRRSSRRSRPASGEPWPSPLARRSASAWPPPS